MGGMRFRSQNLLLLLLLSYSSCDGSKQSGNSSRGPNSPAQTQPSSNSNGNSPASELPAPENLAPPRAVKDANIAYDFNGTMSRFSATGAAVRMLIQNGSLKGKTQL